MAKKKKVEAVLTESDSIQLYISERETVWRDFESIEIQLDEYPELVGKTKAEVIEYLKENASQMKAPADYDWANDLEDCLSQQDVAREKFLDTENFFGIE